MKRLLLAGVLTGGPLCIAQTPAANYVASMTFDVASLRVAPAPNSYSMSIQSAPHSSSVVLENFDLPNLLEAAFGVDRARQEGLPDWSRQMLYTVRAKASDAADVRLAHLSSEDAELEKQHMMRALLEERLGLRAHWEMRDGRAYALLVGTPGRLQAKDAPPLTDAERTAFGADGAPPIYQRGNSEAGFEFVAHDASMRDLQNELQPQLGAPVRDATGLTGRYSFVLSYRNTWQAERSGDDASALPALDRALEEQLGLRLKPERGSVRVLVVDHVERQPEAN